MEAGRGGLGKGQGRPHPTDEPDLEQAGLPASSRPSGVGSLLGWRPGPCLTGLSGDPRYGMAGHSVQGAWVPDTAPSSRLEWHLFLKLGQGCPEARRGAFPESDPKGPEAMPCLALRVAGGTVTHCCPPTLHPLPPPSCLSSSAQGTRGQKEGQAVAGWGVEVWDVTGRGVDLSVDVLLLQAHRSEVQRLFHTFCTGEEEELELIQPGSQPLPRPSHVTSGRVLNLCRPPWSR